MASERPEAVASAESDLTTAIMNLEQAEREFYENKYEKPADEVYEGALQMMGESFTELAQEIAGALGGQADLSNEAAGQGVL